MKYPEIKVLKNNPSFEGLASIKPGVVYSNAGGSPLTLELIFPQRATRVASGEKYPLIVFVQGSAWTHPDVNYEIPQLAEFARAGYIVATLIHRSCNDGFMAPAFLVDVKCAIRFLRANAEEYAIDPERVCIWGTSSGGNTSQLVALTGDFPEYKSSEYSEYSDAVKLSVECFGPSDMLTQFGLDDSCEKIEESDSFAYKLSGGAPELLKNVSPMHILARRVKEGKCDGIPPMLLLHGDKDEAVPYEQSENLFHALCDAGKSAKMIRVEGAEHEGSFWSRALLAEIKEFIDENI